MTTEILIPPIFKFLKEKNVRYKVSYGGRGGGKSHAYARSLILLSDERKGRILCTREIQRSIKDSVQKLLTDIIIGHGYEQKFKITDNSIVNLKTGSQFIFCGLYRNVNQIKSMEGIDICWVEEAHSVSSESWKMLIPTIRKENSEIWVSFNRQLPNDPVYDLFCSEERKDVLSKRVNYYDNPYFPDVLKSEMEFDKSRDHDKYMHVWEGEPLIHSEAQVFNGYWKTDIFDTPERVQFYHGCDWGFSKDPTALVRFYIQDNILYIDREVYGIKIDIDKLPAAFSAIETARNHQVLADNARPETISYMNKHGYMFKGARKWKGCKEDRIEFMKSFDKIVIHELNCPHVIDEFKMFSYDRDRLTGDITTKIIDEHDHAIDAIGYGLDRVMRSNKVKTRLSLEDLGL